MAKIWRSRDIIGVEDAQRWENKADATHRHRVSDIDGLETIIGNQTTNKASQADLTAHIQNRNNPHNVTKAQVGLGNVENIRQASYYSVEALQREFQEHEDRLNAIEYMFLQNDFTAPIRTEDSTEHTLLADENGHVIVADWKYRMEV